MSKKYSVNDSQQSLIAGSIFFLLAWAWAAWWMGDVLRIAYERSFFSTDATLMHGLWQQQWGWLWYLGRALLTLYRWPVAGGLLVALLLTCGAWLTGYALRLPRRWRCLRYLPATAWMLWTAHVGLNLFYMRDPGRILAVPFVGVVLIGVGAAARKVTSMTSTTSHASLITALLELAAILLAFAIPGLYLTHRHPYLRPLTQMQVQLLNNDYAGMSQTAHEHADMSYRQMVGYYAIALLRTGRLAEQLFDIRIEYDSVRAIGYFDEPNECMEYHTIDCNYHAGLIRAARHQAVLDLTMDGPSLYILKSLTKISLIEGDWALARKFLRIISKAPFEGDFRRKYEPMVERPDLVQADPEFAAIKPTLPAYHVLENMFPRPAFIGYYASRVHFKSAEAQQMAAVACLYARRMDDFLQYCQPYAGSMPPRAIAEGIITQVSKYPELLNVFPQLQMGVERYRLFMQDAAPYMDNRIEGGKALFDRYKGYYPYYYYFGNQRGTRKTSGDAPKHFDAGVN